MDNSNHNQQQQVAQPQPLSMAAPTGVPPQQRPPQIRAGGAMMHHGGGHGGGGAQPPINIQNEIMWIKQDAQQVRGAVLLLEAEKVICLFFYKLLYIGFLICICTSM